jgi:hypothetical protein
VDAPADWQNPIKTMPGLTQTSVDPKQLRPSRSDVISNRLEFQRQLLLAGVPRFTPILSSREGVIIDGHHAVRAAAEEGRTINVMISNLVVPAQADSILDLPIR